jgi:hypothetical protein
MDTILSRRREQVKGMKRHVQVSDEAAGSDNAPTAAAELESAAAAEAAVVVAPTRAPARAVKSVDWSIGQ